MTMIAQRRLMTTARRTAILLLLSAVIVRSAGAAMLRVDGLPEEGKIDHGGSVTRVAEASSGASESSPPPRRRVVGREKRHRHDRQLQQQRSGFVTISILGLGGKLSIHDEGLGADGDPNTVSVEFVYLREVTADGLTEVGMSGNVNTHAIESFAGQDFDVQSMGDVNVGTASAKKITLNTTLEYGPGRIKVDTLLFSSAGVVTAGTDESWRVDIKDVKFNIELSNWEFCDPCAGGTGAYIDIGVLIKGRSGVPVKTDDLTYDLGGDVPLYLSGQVLVQDDIVPAWEPMEDGYPKMEQNGVFVLRFPKFKGRAMFDPIIAYSLANYDDTESGSPSIGENPPNSSGGDGRPEAAGGPPDEGGSSTPTLPETAPPTGGGNSDASGPPNEPNSSSGPPTETTETPATGVGNDGSETPAEPAAPSNPPAGSGENQDDTTSSNTQTDNPRETTGSPSTSDPSTTIPTAGTTTNEDPGSLGGASGGSNDLTDAPTDDASTAAPTTSATTSSATKSSTSLDVLRIDHRLSTTNAFLIGLFALFSVML